VKKTKRVPYFRTIRPVRSGGRKPDELRPLRFTRGFTEFAQGSVLMELGRTRVLCTAMVADGVPPFLYGSGQGWLTAEYAMLPSATPGSRKTRDGRGSRTDGRSVEIQRLLGRALRSVVDLKAFPDRTIWVDCDVLQADGGTRVASITGASVALYDAFLELDRRGILARWPLRARVAGISVGLVGGEIYLDLDYAEDSGAEADMNVVLTEEGEYVEIQGGAEKRPLPPAELESMLEVARRGCERLFEAQAQVLGLTQ